MVEALIIGCYGGTTLLANSNYGWGARVDINPPTQIINVKYQCISPQSNDCKRRSTVDFGYWDGYHGQFYECKAQPARIGCKEVPYMEGLKKELDQNRITHEIFFVCAAPRDEVQMRLEEEHGLSPVYKPIGIEDIRSMMPA